jgi:hypothetical protein
VCPCLRAGHGGIANIIDDMQLLSTEAEGVSEAMPEERRRALVNRAGRVGALLGLTDTRVGAADCEWLDSCGSLATVPACLHGMSMPCSALAVHMSRVAALSILRLTGAFRPPSPFLLPRPAPQLCQSG